MPRCLYVVLFTTILATTACSAERAAPLLQGKPPAPIAISLQQDGPIDNGELGLRIDVVPGVDLEAVEVRVKLDQGLILPDLPSAERATLAAGELLSLALKPRLTEDFGILTVVVSAQGEHGPLGRVVQFACGDPPPDWNQPEAPIAEDEAGRPLEESTRIQPRIRAAD
jgi:hypothetical protein